MITADEIVNLYKIRRDAQGPLMRQMKQIQDLVNGDVIVPLNELDSNAKSNVANLVSIGLEQMSMRIASTMPVPYFPPLKEGQERAKELARNRKKAMLSIWDANRMSAKMRRRSRHMLAYSSAPVIIKPDFKNNIPKWHVRNPLDTYPSPMEDPDDPVPDNVIFSYSKTYKWVLDNYGFRIPGLPFGPNVYDEKITMLEYVCENEIVVVLTASDAIASKIKGMPTIELERIPNRTGRPLVVIPQRISLDKPRGQFDGSLGMYYTRSRLQALTEIAIERGIFPDEYLVARPGENPQVIQVADGKLGMLGIVKGGDITQLQTNPGYKTDVALDRLERQERLEGAIPAEFGGESGSNIRTGRRGENVLSATIDFRVQEAQAIFEQSIMEEDKIAISIEKAYWGNTPKAFYLSGRKGGRVDYTPSKLWENDYHNVSYSASGSDVNSLIVGLGQRLGAGLMSKESAREADPLVADAELERDRITAEAMESALLTSIQQQAADPNGPYQPADLAYLTKLVLVENIPIYDAVERTQKRAQERQATPAPEPPMPGGMAPEAMPGLAMPGMGAEQPVSAPGGGGMEALLAQLGGQ
jgi:hypothetical protein